MSIGLKIKELAKMKNLSLADIAKSLGKTKQTVYEMVEKEDVSTQIIRKLSQIYHVPITFFFDETPAGTVNNTVRTSGDYSPAQVGGDFNVNSDPVLAERVKYLEKLVEEKERVISLLYEKINNK